MLLLKHFQSLCNIKVNPTELGPPLAYPPNTQLQIYCFILFQRKNNTIIEKKKITIILTTYVDEVKTMG